MQIQPLNLNNTTNITLNKTCAPKSIQALQNAKDSVSFCGYGTVIKKVATTIYKTDSEVENAFIKLFNTIKEDNTIYKTPHFDSLDEIYQKGGFRGMLNEIWKTNPQDTAKKLLKASEDKNIILATKNDEPILELVNWGKFGFSKNNPNETKIAFWDGKQDNMVEFCLNKKGECTLSQTYGDSVLYTEYYSTGNRKVQTHQFGSCMPERTFYNKDGSKAFWKNFFRGGVIPPLW